MNYKYGVHQREWNNGNIVAVIFVLNSLSECMDFKEEQNNVMDRLYEGKSIGDEYLNFASIYNNQTEEYVLIRQ